MKQHQFEKLLFGDEDLTSSDKGKMKRFVLDHPEAAQLEKHWNDVRTQLSKAEEKSPQSGFTQRWIALQIADQQRKVQVQAFWAILFSAIAAGVLAYLAIGSEQSLLLYVKDFLITAINLLLEISSLFQIVSRVVFSVLQKFPASWWISVVSALLLLPLLWLVVYRELVSIKGVAQ